MTDSYSLYEAKAHLSAIIRRVREGHSVIVTLHGEPVAEIRPLASAAIADGLTRRLAQLAEQGTLIAASGSPARVTPGPRRPGALQRFLADRGE